MPPPALPADDARQRRHLRWALAAWAGFTLLLLVGTSRLPATRQSVVQHYRTASSAWVEGRPVYGEGREHGFLYLPSFAVLHAPFALLPLPAGGLLWRAANVALLGAGVWLLARALGRERRGTFLLVASVVLLGAVWTTARHGQATLAMGGCMLAGAAMLCERRLWAAAAWLALGVALKPLSLAALLVAAAVTPGLRLRAALLLLAVLLLPFLAQAPGYVLAQYEGFARMIATAGSPVDRHRFPDLLYSLSLLGLDLSPRAALLVRALAGAAALGAFAWVRRRADDRVTALLFYALTSAYLLAFNPRTEHNTYSLFAPALAAAVAWALAEGQRRAALGFALLTLALKVDYDITHALTGHALPWTKPLLLAVALGVLLRHAARARWAFGAPATPDAPSPAR